MTENKKELLNIIYHEGYKSIGNFNDFKTLFHQTLDKLYGKGQLNAPTGYIRTTAMFRDVRNDYQAQLRGLVNDLYDNKIGLMDGYSKAKNIINKGYVKSGLLGGTAIAPALYGDKLPLEDMKFFQRAAKGEIKRFNDVVRKSYNTAKGKDNYSQKMALERANRFSYGLKSMYIAGSIMALPSDIFLYWTRTSGESCIALNEYVTGSFGMKYISQLKDGKDKVQSAFSQGETILKPKGIQKTININTHLGMSLRLTGDHLVAIYNNKSANVEFKQASKIKRNDYLILKKNTLTKISNGVSWERIQQCLAMGYVYGCKNQPDKFNDVGYPKNLRITIDQALGTIGFPGLGKSYDENNVAYHSTYFHRRKREIDEMGLFTSTPNIKDLIIDRNTAIAFVGGFFLRQQTLLTHGEKVFSSNFSSQLRFIQNLLFSLGVVSSRKYVGTNKVKMAIYGGSNIGYLHEMIVALMGVLEASAPDIMCEYKPLSTTEMHLSMNEKNLSNDFIAVKAENNSSNHMCFVYDLVNMPDECFIANGFLVHNCTDCILMEGGNPYTTRGARRMRTTPGAGDTACLSNCQCRILVRKTKKGKDGDLEYTVDDMINGFDLDFNTTIKARDKQNQIYTPNDKLNKKTPYEINVNDDTYVGFFNNKKKNVAEFMTTKGNIKVPVADGLVAFELLNKEKDLLPKEIKNLENVPEIYKQTIGNSKVLLNKYGYYQRQGKLLGYANYDLYALILFLSEYEKDEDTNEWKKIEVPEND